MAPEPCKLNGLSSVFHSFCNGFHSQRAAQRDDCGSQAGAIGIIPEAVYEGLVDLDADGTFRVSGGAPVETAIWGHRHSWRTSAVRMSQPGFEDSNLDTPAGCLNWMRNKMTEPLLERWRLRKVLMNGKMAAGLPDGVMQLKL